MSKKLSSVIHYPPIDINDGSENVHPISPDPEPLVIPRASTSAEYDRADVFVPPTPRTELAVHPSAVLPTFERLLLMDRYGSSYIAIDQVLEELDWDRDRIFPFLHKDKIVLLYDAGFKIAVCRSLVVYER